MSEGEFWGDIDKYGQVDKYGQIEPHHNYGGGGGGGGFGGGGGGGGGEEVIDGEWYIVNDQPAVTEYDYNHVNVDAYSEGYNVAPEMGDKFHTWHGRPVTEYEFDALRHDEFVAQTGGRETGGLFGIHTTDFGSGWGDRSATSAPYGVPQSWGSNQPRQLPGGRSAPRLPGANMPRMSAPNYPQLTDSGGIAYSIIGAVLGGIARVFGWK